MRAPRPVRQLSAILAGDSTLKSLFFVALGVRLVLLPWFSDPTNFWGFQVTTSFLLRGWNPWQAIAADPALAQLNPWGYPPLFFAITVPASWLSFGNGYVFGILVRLPLVAADLGTGIFLLLIGGTCGLGPTRSRALCLAYWFNPFVILVSTIWGTTDPLAVLCVAAALYYQLSKPARHDAAAIALGLGIAFKLYPLVLVPLFVAGSMGWRSRIRFLAIAAVPFLFSSAPVLWASPAAFLRVLVGFTVVPGVVGTDQNLLYAAVGSAGIPSLVPTVVAAVGFSALLGALVAAVRRNRVRLLVACTIAVLAIFLAAPRYNQNYFLWAVSLVLLGDALVAWERGSHILAVWSWVPIALDALIYNGTGGATGLSYWSLISVGRPVGFFSYVPAGTHAILQAMFLLMVAATLVGLWNAERGPRAPVYGSPMRPGRLVYPARDGHPRAVIAVAVALFLVAALAINADHQPATPDDLGVYSLATDMTTFTDDFQAPVLGVGWTFQGSGIAYLNPDGGGLVLDTVAVNGTARIERMVPDSSTRVTMTADVLATYAAPGVLPLIEFSGGWIGVVGATHRRVPSFFTLVFYDQTSRTATDIGYVVPGLPFTIGLAFSPSAGFIEYNSTVLQIVPHSFGGLVEFGQPGLAASTGGAFVIHEITVAWPTQVPQDYPFVFATALGILAGAVLAPSYVLRRRLQAQS